MQSQDQLSHFDQLIQPLNIMIEIVFTKYCAAAVAKLKENYKDSVKNNNTSIDQIKEILTNGNKIVLQSISPTYLTKLKNVYSEDGIIFYIESGLKQLIDRQIMEASS